MSTDFPSPIPLLIHPKSAGPAKTGPASSPFTIAPLGPFGKIIIAGTERDPSLFAGEFLKRLMREDKLILFRGFTPVRDSLFAVGGESVLTERIGETRFTDTSLIWKKASEEVKEIWRKVSLTYETGTHLLVNTHPNRGEVILRFSENFLKVTGLSKTLSEWFLRDLMRKVRSPKFSYTHAWHKGDFAVIDSHAVIFNRI